VAYETAEPRWHNPQFTGPIFKFHSGPGELIAITVTRIGGFTHCNSPAVSIEFVCRVTLPPFRAPPSSRMQRAAST